MAATDSSDDGQLVEPSRKKRKAAKAAEAKLQELERMFSPSEEHECELIGHEDMNVPATSRTRKSMEDISGGEIAFQRQRAKSEDNDSGQEHDDEENDSDDLADEDFESESDGDDQAASTSACKSPVQKDKRDIAGCHDFAPPVFLQTVLNKRQMEMEKIRRRLPVDNQTPEQKLANWSEMLSTLGKPIVLLSLISPPPHQ